jgi:acetyl esterase/lipase
MSTPKPVLEGAAQAFAAATSNPPFLHDLGPVEGRKAVDSVQEGDIPVPDADVEDLVVPGGPSGQVSIRVFRPAGVQGPLPVVLYIHGAGWVFGNAHTHDRLVRELTIHTQAATVFVNYSLSPEAKYPTAVEEIYATLLWISREGAAQTARAQITASPPRASLEELAGLPQALVIVAEADVLRDEGEAYAARLRAASVPTTAVLYQGVIHDFAMLNALRNMCAARAATRQSGEFLYEALHA